MPGPKRWVRNGWTPGRWVSSLALAALGIGATSDAWADIVRIAVRDEEASHILLVPIIVAWLAWLRRGRLRQCLPNGFWVGPLLVACGWFLYSFGDTMLFESLWHFGAVLVAAGCALTVLGRDVLIRFLPALVALGFLVPVPGRVRQKVAIPLETATAAVTQRVVHLTGESVERSGNLLTINGADVTIAEACNGLRMVFALTLVSYAFAFGTPLRPHTRLIILVASPLSAVICNVIRLVPTVWMYGHRPGAFTQRVHDWGAWLMLGASFLMLMAVLRVLRWGMVPVGPYTRAYD